MLNKYPRVIVAGIRGGSGKTTITLAIICALRAKKKLKVIPFKKGPDYIDSGWLSKFADNPCYNLDPFLISKENVHKSFINHSNGHISIIEGNRGLYDGMDIEGTYSTAELAKLLSCPVILILDCTKITRTAAALVKGCAEFDKSVMIKGIILNQVGTQRHEQIVKASIEKYCSIPVVGAIPRLKTEALPERHMGLIPYQEYQHYDIVNSYILEISDKYLDIEKIYDIANDAPQLQLPSPDIGEADSVKEESIKIGVIKDSAFQFYYPENLEELKKRGAKIIDIDATSDVSLPEIHALYIGGGFPETNATKLAQNITFKNSVKDAAECGLPIYAECGGLMFLGKELIINSESFSMVGVFPLTFQMKKKPQAHGYTIVEIDRENPFYPKNTVLYGHEFHYSMLKDAPDNLATSFKMIRGEGLINKRDGIYWKNTLGTYTHIHALGSKVWVDSMIESAIKYKAIRGI
ncbi:MAG: hydrogenobyrinic acid a,c-diamide synthase (glutamine-hydrolyzing) [Thermodesulfovibrionales bacterium]|nr:hydrogenobyrinic acid a,c-diamide synthase (glutamine-hydrolyzing) [Thermodesulfovibrionales bacterium]